VQVRALPWDLAEHYVLNHRYRGCDTKAFQMESVYPECHFVARIERFLVRPDSEVPVFVERMLKSLGRTGPSDKSSHEKEQGGGAAVQ
jgi:hypothetical protein